MPKDDDEATWGLRGGLLTTDPHDVAPSVFKEDDANRARTDRCCPEELEVSDESLAALTGILKGYYESKDGWASNLAIRTAIGLVGQCWNYLAAVRHLIRLGYFGEAHSVRRAWFERATFAQLLFASQDRDLAAEWGEGDRPKQKDVHERIQATISDPEYGAEVYSGLQQQWKYLNDYTHPDAESLLWRTLQADAEKFQHDRRGALADVAGDQPVLGGLVRGSTFQKAALLLLARDVLYTCSVMLLTAPVSTLEQWAPVVRDADSRRVKLLSNLRSEGKAVKAVTGW